MTRRVLLPGVHQTGETRSRAEMLADGRARGPARLGERRDIGLLAGQRVQEREPGAVAQEGEEFRAASANCSSPVSGCT